MQPFRTHTGLVAPLDRANVDTDQIIPKQFLKRIERTGFGQFLFFDWRFLDDGRANPEFELNQPAVRGAAILLARRNFGCGSSREHAPWALEDYGFRVLIAPSFADIFYNNCFKNGVLPIRLDEDTVQRLFDRSGRQPGYQLTVDLEQYRISDERATSLSHSRSMSSAGTSLLEGLDDIALTLQHEDKIAAYEARRVRSEAGGGRLGARRRRA